MKKIIVIIFALGMMSSAFADSKITCRLTSMDNVFVSATLPISASGNGGIESSGNGLDIGNENYNFTMGIEKGSKSYKLDVIFYENNHVQDEVAAKSCEFKLKKGTFLFCQEPLTSETGKVIAQFACKKH